MQVPVRARSGEKSIQIGFAKDVPASWLQDWNGSLTNRGGVDRQLDAIEYLESVINKWAFYRRKDRVVRSEEELRRRLATRESELLGVLVASAPWFQGGTVAGFCQFRRTWCHHIVFDFLGVHPLLLVPETREISGLGTALLYRLAMVAMELQTENVWAETTDLSANFYANLFGLPSLQDVLFISTPQFCAPLLSAVEAHPKTS
ncbi:MAG TPA: hypothetical protein VGO11_26115 [Chthoniobacteraceae bacterium]|jgi:N-acetylglutamate synthase-like GNAT family acetyltransferase|nr:hypothetical protein [Chthoniobacteraceae bacterium]